jgi:outer membrane protein TolC
MVRYLFFIPLLIVAVSAQTTDTIRKYSLQDILSIANKQGNRIRIIQTRTDADLQQVEIYKAEAYPDINLNTSIGYANQSLLGRPFESSAFINRIDGFLFSWSFSLQQPVFRFGQIINSFKLASLSKKISQNSSNLQRDNYFLEVINQFIQTYTGQFDYIIATQSLNRSERIYQRTLLDFETGQVSKRELLRTQASLERDRALLLSSSCNRALSIRKLNILIGLKDPADYLLVLDTVESFLKVPSQYSGENLQIVQKRLEADFNTYLRKNAWSSFFPSLNLFGSIFNEFMAVDTSGLTEMIIGEPEAGEIIPEIPVSSDFFNPDLINYSIGLELSWNIFDGKRSFARYRQAKKQEKATFLELEQIERENRNQILEVKDQISVTDNTIEAYRLQLEASQKALQQADSDFQDGFIDAITYLEIEQEYRNAALNLDNQKLRRLLLQAQLRVALGLRIFGD